MYVQIVRFAMVQFLIGKFVFIQSYTRITLIITLKNRWGKQIFGNNYPAHQLSWNYLHKRSET